jgi:hypothetical protein
MASTLFPDPFQLWRDAVTKLEGDVNSLATGSMKSQEVARSLHQFSTVSLGMQQMFERVIEAYLRKANLPSRKEVAELAESLRRIEDKLDRLVPAQALGVPAPRPARTRRPSGAAAVQEDAKAATTASVPAATRARRSPHRGKG